MTMTRTDKKSHAVQMRNAREHGITSIRFSSPILAHAAREARGHDLMTGSEYAVHHIGRHTIAAELAWSTLMGRRGFRSQERGSWVKRTKR